METLSSQISEKLSKLESSLESANIQSIESALEIENGHLLNYVNQLKEELIRLELESGSEVPEAKKQEPLPSKKTASQDDKPAPPKATASSDSNVDISKLNFRIGKILEVSKHPDAESLYVEKVDVGEAVPRTIISGLVKHVAIEKMQGLVGVFLCNLKPAKMRGIESQGMLMCASGGDEKGVEPLIIDCPDLKPGTRIIVQDFPGDPETVLNPKKKILEQIKPDMAVSADGIALYKTSHWIVEGYPDSRIRAPNIRSVPIS
ncbi:Aminoacyl tRNA synthase complex-interacting multifunctional protein 1 [Cichlidogyrus casuarinus]|uniref:Aminoacyl tRNA synthase complex-interacting multifunctional protein 1 n=1 Tax=Cichlidogyrus casuarinus TaxID=1844966 RepID=A0ABD2QD07_9PLAT